jgi:hypothetical protein
LAERSLYQVLNVAASAEPEVIEAAYRTLMKKYHPDRAGESALRSKASEINAAYSVLRDPHRRADYDRRETARRQACAAGPPLPPWPPQAPPQPRRFSAAMWSGWAVALMIGGFAATMPMERRILVGPAAPPAAPAVAAAGFAAEGTGPVLPAALAEAALAPVAEAAAPPLVTTAAAAVTQPLAQPRRNTAAQHRRPTGGGGRPASAVRGQPGDREFLEREGFIY